MTPSRVVFDASLVIRAVVAERSDALDWIRRAEAREVDAIVPDLLFAECAHAFLRYVRGLVLEARSAFERLELVTELRLDVRPLAPLVGPAFAVAVDRGLSVYDACYALLAEAERAVLVTADRRLAAAAQNVLLLP